MTTDSPLTVAPDDDSKCAAVKCAAGRPRSSDRAARQQELVHTAGALFIKHGYPNVSLEMLAREAHVAVRTIYVKFGGKAGLLTAVLEANREKFYRPHEMLADPRPLKESVRDFALHFLDLISRPEALAMHRMVVADAPANTELAQTFFEGGPQQTRKMLLAFFSRADIRCQLRDELDVTLLPVYLMNCIIGDPYERMLFAPAAVAPAQVEHELDQRLDLFYRSVLKNV
ncbi:TetR/AcrR family transcriptional regulator [Massilia sp. DWR3-1-1]|uniref:TetR/AcrR family transcriptional regulator n=1 Tax=Massilia sp. DWR3-1-1 TaxID=2804559 RepID=UPI003CEFD476